MSNWIFFLYTNYKYIHDTKLDLTFDIFYIINGITYTAKLQFLTNTQNNATR